MIDPNCRLLLVTSDCELADAVPITLLRRQAAVLNMAGVVCDIVVDPSQLELEQLVRRGAYDAVMSIPLFGYAYDHQTGAPYETYSIPQLLEQHGIPFIGCSHYVQLLTADKTVSLARSGCGIPGWMLSRTALASSAKPAAALDFLSADAYPVFVKPNTLCGSLGIDTGSIADGPEAVASRAAILFERFPSLREVRIEPYMGHHRQFTVGVLGNNNRVVCSVSELHFPDGKPCIYDYDRKSTPLTERDVEYRVVYDGNLRDELEFCARRVFQHLGMRDYARFDFFLSGEPILHDINSHPTLGNSFSWEWQQLWDILPENLLAFPLAAFHLRQLADGLPSRVPEAVLNLLPAPLRAALVGPAPVTAPPELTPPHPECLTPERYHCVDGTAVETEVLDFLSALVRLIKPGLIVETGTYRGASAEAMARALVANGTGHLVTVECDHQRAEAARRRLHGLPVEVITGASLEFLPNAPIDLLFLDSHRPIRGNEFTHFKPFLHAGSVVVWHDSAPHHPGVRPAIEDLAGQGIIDRLHLPTPRGLCLSMPGRPPKVTHL